MNRLFLLLAISCMSFPALGCGHSGGDTNPEADKEVQQTYDSPDYEAQMRGQSGDKK